MTIDEAIKFNLDTLQYGAHILDTKCYKALELGIEALKHYQRHKRSGTLDPSYKLPGEDSIPDLAPSADRKQKLQEVKEGE